MNTPDDNPLRSLDREAPPPAALKARVQKSLKERGLLRRRMNPMLRAAGLIAAALVVFAAGLMIGNREVEVPAVGATYALLLYEDSSFQRDRPEAEYIEEYGKWAGELRRRGALVAGEALDSTALLLSPRPSGVEVEVRSASSDLGVMAGFFIIRAASREEALNIAMSCPHLNHGGRIALRPIIPT